MHNFDSRHAAVTQIRTKLETDVAFQQKDRRSRWFCPYCAQVIRHIQLTEDPMVRGQEAPFHIAIHLMEECAAFKAGAEPSAQLPVDVPLTPLPDASAPDKPDAPPPGPPEPPAGVRHSRRTDLDGVVAFARKRMQEDELFRQRDPRNRWFCPYCGNIVRSILLPDDMMLALQDVPFLIADHLANECRFYNEQSHPSKRLRVSAAAEKRPADTQVMRGLHEARRRQRHMLPSRVPQVEGVEFECFYQPCDVISGDFYDFIRVSEHELGLLIGDVSGHGIEAAIVMAMVRKLIQVHGRSRSSAAETLIVTNHDIADDVGDGVFISAFYGVLDTRAHTLTCARAGHPPPLLFNPARMEAPTQIAPRGLAMGLDRGNRFQRLLEEWVVEIEPGDLVFAFTDGLIELEDPEGRGLGLDGLCELVKRYGDRRPADAVRQVITASQKFAQSTTADDDITVVAFRLASAGRGGGK